MRGCAQLGTACERERRHGAGVWKGRAWDEQDSTDPRDRMTSERDRAGALEEGTAL